MFDPIVIDPPDFDMKAAWAECAEETKDGFVLEDGSPNWRAAFSADPGCCSCPACKAMHWAWGRRQRCTQCDFEYPTNWWPMYADGARARRMMAAYERDRPDLVARNVERHGRHMASPYYRHGYENPTDEAWLEKDRIDWRAVVACNP